MQFSAAFVAAAAAFLPSLVSAHYYFPHLTVDGVESDEFVYVRRSTQGYQPHFGFDILSNNDLRCNTGSSPNDGTQTASVVAGGQIAFGTNLAAQIQHPGPIQVYMSKAPGSVSDYDGSGDWFKILELGPSADTLTGAATEWQAYDLSTIPVTIPAGVEDGEYLVRIEHVALHRPSGTEFYFNCAQISVTGGAGSAPTDTITFPGDYSSTTPGFSPNFSIYSGLASSQYPMPGPAIYSGTTTGSEETVNTCSSKVKRSRIARALLDAA